jgi:SagB-type dehydrogenase family enzyme
MTEQKECSTMSFAREYANDILHRGRVPMPPLNFTPNWADRPRKWKYYPGAEILPLPDADVSPTATVQEALFGDAEPGTFSLASLGGMLLDSYGVLGRRLGIQANTDLAALPHYTHANFSRGAASGGGLYPISIYLIAGAGGPLTPGAYHYSVPHHGLQQLMAGDVSDQVRRAVDLPQHSAGTDHFLLVAVKYWQNAFKYNSFSFHAVSMDVGAALEAMRLWARAHGLPLQPALWFDEPRIAELLGVRGEQEGIFAAIPLAWNPVDNAADRNGQLIARADNPPAVRHSDQEASRAVITFEPVRRMQAATADGCATRPAPTTLLPALALPVRANTARCPLPPTGQLDMNIRTAVRRRRSSFGRFQAACPVPARQLATALAAAAAAIPATDVTTAGSPLVKLYAFVNHVDGIAPGNYEYDPTTRELAQLSTQVPGPFLQRNYFLSNYNLEQSAAVIVPTIRTGPVLRAIGDRGYRLINASIGAVAQALYTASAAMGIGCGVALGFDNVSFIEELRLEGTDETPLLVMMIGNERPVPADFRYEIA